MVPPLPGATVKNLFLRDKKGRRYILLVMEDMKKIDLKVLAGNLGLSNLSLASAERLMEYLGVEPGAVSLLALVNDSTKQVEVFIDQDIWKAEALQSHPLINTETLVIKIEDMERFLEATGHQFELIEIE